jgi:hypothetical protein
MNHSIVLEAMAYTPSRVMHGVDTSDYTFLLFLVLLSLHDL